MSTKRKYTEEQRTAQRLRVSIWQKNNKDKVREIKKRYIEKHSERVKEGRRVLYLENKEKIRARSAANTRARKEADPEGFSLKRFFEHQLRTYGLSREGWERLFESQGRRCGCCSSDTPGGRLRWHTDHDHATGKVRGVLCHGCNIMLGGSRDQQQILIAGASYLARTK